MTSKKSNKRKIIRSYRDRVTEHEEDWLYHWKEYRPTPNMRFLNPPDEYISKQIKKATKKRG